MDLTDFNKSGVRIIGLSDCGEKLTAASGRISTQEGTALSIWAKSQDDEKNRNLIDKVTRSGHNSVVEHTYYNLAFQNVSAVVEQFVIEFRLASFTVKSRRYVDFSDAGFYIPENADANYVKHMRGLFALYSEFCEAGVPKEDARFLLPYCLFSNFFCSINGRELLHLLKAMLHGRGKRFPEIYQLGLELKAQAQRLTPGILVDFDERAAGSCDVPDLSFIERPLPDMDVPKEAVELLSYTPNAAKCVARNALITALGVSTQTAHRMLADDAVVAQTVQALVRCSRPRALEAAVFTLRFNGVSLSEVTHFTRHRMQSIEIPSLTDTNRSVYTLPESIRRSPELLEKYKAAFAQNAAEYARLKADGYSEEALIYYQLSGNTVDLTVTMNARELMLFCKLRTCTRAQWEIRAHAIAALNVLRCAAPEIFCYYGPSCFVTGKCPEGRFCCGRQDEVRDEFTFSALPESKA